MIATWFPMIKCANKKFLQLTYFLVLLFLQDLEGYVVAYLASLFTQMLLKTSALNVSMELIFLITGKFNLKEPISFKTLDQRKPEYFSRSGCEICF